MGVVTYFLLCGYTPFGTHHAAPQPGQAGQRKPSADACHVHTRSDRENQVDEVQAICNADYAFEPAEYWTGVSDTGPFLTLALWCSLAARHDAGWARLVTPARVELTITAVPEQPATLSTGVS